MDVDSDEFTDTITIDRPFQEQVWKWLVSHPECRVGTRGQGGRPSRSEAEVTNHALRKHEAIANQAPSKPSALREDTQAIGAPLISNSADGSAQRQSTSEQTGIPEISQSGELNASDPYVDWSHDGNGEVRIYANEERMWHALAGHGIDYSKIPSLDFACLSIIAAAGPRGITQPELVKLSDQDKRSVPRRTQDLFEKGYITKTPVLSGASRTCLCTLKRFIPAPDAKKPENDSASGEPNLDVDSQAIFQRCFPDGGANLYLLLSNIFDVLDRFKMITMEDMRRKLVSFEMLRRGSTKVYRDTDGHIGLDRAPVGERCLCFNSSKA